MDIYTCPGHILAIATGAPGAPFRMGTGATLSAAVLSMFDTDILNDGEHGPEDVVLWGLEADPPEFESPEEEEVYFSESYEHLASYEMHVYTYDGTWFVITCVSPNEGAVVRLGCGETLAEALDQIYKTPIAAGSSGSAARALSWAKEEGWFGEVSELPTFQEELG